MVISIFQVVCKFGLACRCACYINCYWNMRVFVMYIVHLCPEARTKKINLNENHTLPDTSKFKVTRARCCLKFINFKLHFNFKLEQWILQKKVVNFKAKKNRIWSAILFELVLNLFRITIKNLAIETFSLCSKLSTVSVFQPRKKWWLVPGVQRFNGKKMMND